jgi:dipeptidyl aminopeptidase/acylaminoacyl peptidase
MSVQQAGVARMLKVLELPSLLRNATVTPVWRADGSRFAYLTGAPDQTAAVDVDPPTGKTAPLLDTERVRKAIEDELGVPLPYAGLPFTAFRFVDADAAIRFETVGHQLRLELDTYAVSRVGPAELHADARRVPRVIRKRFLANTPPLTELLSPDGRLAATETPDGLAVRSTYDDRLQAVTTDNETDNTWTVDGAKWSPDSFQLAALKVDHRRCEKLPIVHWLKTTEEVEWAPYVKAGGPGARIELHVVDVLARRTTKVDLGPDEELSVHVVGWTSDSRTVVFVTTNRRCNVVQLRAADARTGESRLIVEERQETFVRGIRSDFDGLTRLVGDDRVLFLSERDGWAHLYLYTLDGDELAQVTSGEWEVEQIVAVDLEAGTVVFAAHPDVERPYDLHLCAASLDGSGFTQLTSATGQHEGVASPSGQVVVDPHSTVSRPPQVDALHVPSRTTTTLTTADTSRLEELGWTPPEEFTALAADGTTVLHGTFYFPPDFDPARRYPVVEFIYGGPQVVRHARTFTQTGNELANALAQLGFVTYCVDGRGTPGRGKAFQDVAFGAFGEFVVRDHVAVLKQLGEQRPYLDMSRVGITGGSWGGYNTVRSLLTAPDMYAAGVAVYPVGDLYDHMATAIEPYMGFPQDNRAGYEAASSLAIADRLRGKLLLVHGTSDVNATFSATMKLVEAFVRADKPVDLLVLPELDHSLNGQSGRYLVKAIARYFTEHLRLESSPGT